MACSSQLAVVKLQAGDKFCRDAWGLICDISRQSFQVIYDRLDVQLMVNPALRQGLRAVTIGVTPPEGVTHELRNMAAELDLEIRDQQIENDALGKVQRLPRFDDEGNVVEAHVMQCSWAGDHRVIDGAEMARFAQLFKAYLEDPTAMLAELR